MERREALVSPGLRGPSWSVSGALVDHAAPALEATRAVEIEGIICKRLTSRYLPGVRSWDWIKVRYVRTTDVIVGGWVPGGWRLAGLSGAVLVVELRSGVLGCIGSVGAGWSDRKRAQPAELLQVAAVQQCRSSRCLGSSAPGGCSRAWSRRSATPPVPGPAACAPLLAPPAAGPRAGRHHLSGPFENRVLRSVSLDRACATGRDHRTAAACATPRHETLDAPRLPTKIPKPARQTPNFRCKPLSA